PSASWNLVDRIDSGTTITLAVYSLVAGSSEPASYPGSWAGSQGAAAVMRNYSGVDTSTPVDGHAGATESSASTTHVAPSVTAAYANEMRVVGIADSSNGLCNTISGWNLTSVASSGANKTGESHFYATTTLPAGPTGTVTATCGSDIGATHQLPLKPSTTPSCTVTATVKKTTPIKLRSSTTKALVNGTSLVMDTPAGVQQNDLMIVVIGWTSSTAAITGVPAGWTLTSSASLSLTTIYTYRRIAGASEPATYTWTLGASATVAAWEGAYVGVDTTTPLDGVIGNGQNGTTHTTGTTSNSSANDMVVAAYSLNAVSTFSTPSGMTAESVVSAGSGPGASLAIYDAIQGSAGTVSPKSTTTSVSAQDANVVLGWRAIASSTVTLGSATTTLGAIGSPTLRSI